MERGPLDLRVLMDYISNQPDQKKSGQALEVIYVDMWHEFIDDAEKEGEVLMHHGRKEQSELMAAQLNSFLCSP